MTMNQRCSLNAIPLTATNYMTIPNGRFSEHKAGTCFTF